MATTDLADLALAVEYDDLSQEVRHAIGIASYRSE